jgi:hypothetical protein
MRSGWSPSAIIATAGAHQARAEDAFTSIQALLAADEDYKQDGVHPTAGCKGKVSAARLRNVGGVTVCFSGLSVAPRRG